MKSFSSLVVGIAFLLASAQAQEPAKKIEFLHTDHLGNVRVVTDENGHVISQHKFLPFGQEFSDDQAGADSANTHKFTGHERDKATGLDYMMARYYANSFVRFVSVDPSRASVARETPSTWNRYSYTRNNPLIRIDPNGMVDIYIGGARDAKGKSGPVRDYVATQASTKGRTVLYFGHGQKKEAIKAANSFVGKEPINIIGQSYGAHTAIKVAKNVNGKVDNLVGADPVGKPDPTGRGRPENVENVVAVNATPKDRDASDAVETMGKAIGGVPGAFKNDIDTEIEVEANHGDFEKQYTTPGEGGQSAKDIVDQSYEKKE